MVVHPSALLCACLCVSVSPLSVCLCLSHTPWTQCPPFPGAPFLVVPSQPPSLFPSLGCGRRDVCLWLWVVLWKPYQRRSQRP